MFEATTFESFDAWRMATRAALAADAVDRQPVSLPGPLMRVLQNIACFRNPGRWELMTRLARRTLTERRDLIEDIVDRDVRHALEMDKAVRRDLHKMHAFVRFREIVASDSTRHYLCWFEPAHEILRRAAPFFIKRFANLHWTIATPDGTALWNGISLEIIDTPAVHEDNVRDSGEDLWRTYYRSICNVARINPRAMLREMPQRYWKHLPEAAEIGPLLRNGREHFEREKVCADIKVSARTLSPQKSHSASDPGLGQSPGALQSCQRCALWQRATQAVAGVGPVPAAVMLVGEQPGDQEDLQGRPFVGPAGALLDELLRDAGLDRSRLYVTNAVKHFSWEPRGKRRLHKRPEAGEIAACNIWLQQEIADVRPRIIVALGATALHALIHGRESIEASRARTLHHPCGARLLATYHPSALLRAEPAAADRLRTALLQDLRQAWELAQR